MSSVALERARGGDQAAFAALIEPYRRELHLHCYRMLGSLSDAEDLLQDALSAAWRGLDSFAGRSSLRTWLYRIATNRYLNAIRDTKRRPLPAPVPPFEPPAPSRHGDVTWLQPYPDAWLDQLPDRNAGPEERHQGRETIELAFIAALQRLPPARPQPSSCATSLVSPSPRPLECSWHAQAQSRGCCSALGRPSNATAPLRSVQTQIAVRARRRGAGPALRRSDDRR